MTTSTCIDAVKPDPIQDLMDHLLTAPLTAWLDVMRRADPQQHYQLIVWMLDQPECDATLALVAFYNSDAIGCLRRRVQIVPDAPERDAIPAIVAEGHAKGRFTHFELGLEHGELDAQMDEMARLLADTTVADRVFEVPMSFLNAPKAKEVELDAHWSPKYDSETAQLYRAAGLLQSPRNAKVVQRREDETENSGLGGVLARLTSMIRRPTAEPLD